MTYGRAYGYAARRPSPGAEAPGETLGPELHPQPEFDSAAGASLVNATITGGNLTLSPFYDPEEEGVTTSFGQWAASEPLSAGTYRVSGTVLSASGGTGFTPSISSISGTLVSAVGDFEQDIEVPVDTGNNTVRFSANSVAGSAVLSKCSFKRVL